MYFQPVAAPAAPTGQHSRCCPRLKYDALHVQGTGETALPTSLRDAREQSDQQGADGAEFPRRSPESSTEDSIQAPA